MKPKLLAVQFDAGHRVVRFFYQLANGGIEYTRYTCKYDRFDKLEKRLESLGYVRFPYGNIMHCTYTVETGVPVDLETFLTLMSYQ